MSSPEAEVTDAAEEAEEAPRDDLREGLLATLQEHLGDALVGHHVEPGVDLWIRVEAGTWRRAFEVARGHLHCTYFDFLSAIDWLPSPFGRDMDAVEDRAAQEEDAPADGEDTDGPPTMEQGLAGGDSRFQLLARLHSPARGYGLFLKADLDDERPQVDTVSDLFAGANWHEREAAEMFGIEFVGHPNPVHLYLPGAFEGYPLRKDFPLLSRRVKPWPGIVDVEAMPGQEEESAAGDVADPTEAEEGAS